MPSEILVYTFRTFAGRSELERLFGTVFVFGSLKNDLDKFIQLICNEKPAYILGVAKGDYTRFEQCAINKFNDHVITPNGIDKYELVIPAGVRLSITPTKSFCNWTMYKIAELIKKYNFDTKLLFCHCVESDVPLLLALVKK